MDLTTLAIYTICNDLLIPIGHREHYKLYTFECSFQALSHDAGVRIFSQSYLGVRNLEKRAQPLKNQRAHDTDCPNLSMKHAFV